jgi:hypothetical protein
VRYFVYICIYYTSIDCSFSRGIEPSRRARSRIVATLQVSFIDTFPDSNRFILMIKTLLATVALCWWGFVSAEVTVLKQVQVIYDRSPKLRIRGSGFDVDEKELLIDIGANRSPSLVAGKDFALTVDEDGDGVVLKLLSNKR